MWRPVLIIVIKKVYIGVILGSYWGNIGNIGVILGLYWGNIGVILG